MRVCVVRPICADAWVFRLAVAGALQHAQALGTVLTGHLMQHVLDVDHVQHLDYLIGDDAYKRNWTPLRRERRGLVAFNPASARGLALAARHFAGRALQRLRQGAPGVDPA